ncbi:hypothetical protein HY990_04810 [Candidatus Micrarchaeota archaeon]|nr:hypothetical protein [Candidatus Micrarchaeota archaeon]
MDHLRDVVVRLRAAFEARDQKKLRKLNDEVLISSAISIDQVTFQLAIFSYVLSKVVSKPRFLRSEFAPSLKDIDSALNCVVMASERSESELLPCFDALSKAISKLEKEDPRFITNLITKGKLKMAATLYAQGMSLGVASEMTGLEKQEIIGYAGETMMFDRLKEEKNISERLKTARKFFFD